MAVSGMTSPGAGLGVSRRTLGELPHDPAGFRRWVDSSYGADVCARRPFGEIASIAPFVCSTLVNRTLNTGVVSCPWATLRASHRPEVADPSGRVRIDVEVLSDGTKRLVEPELACRLPSTE